MNHSELFVCEPQNSPLNHTVKANRISAEFLNATLCRSNLTVLGGDFNLEFSDFLLHEEHLKEVSSRPANNALCMTKRKGITGYALAQRC